MGASITDSAPSGTRPLVDLLAIDRIPILISVSAMPPPPIQVFLTTIASQPALRQRQGEALQIVRPASALSNRRDAEYLLRVLQVKKVAFTSYDLASDEEAKKLWHKQQLPGILIGGEFPGTIQDFEDAVEFGELDAFLRLNEEWQPLEDEKPLLRAVPVGIPGAYSPAQMNPSHVSPAPSPIKTKSREGELDAGDKLGDAGLHGVNVTEDELLALIGELGLGEADAEELVKGLGGSTKPKTQPKPEPEQPDVKRSEVKKQGAQEEKEVAASAQTKENATEAEAESEKPVAEKESV
ncbi:hypothetical protein BN946_scf185007.g257 [Trametes cinnabarina]|uniref:Glutaredoxin domain-containing protein n=1 Tax=Pycnoporus cinnabarinus TaxID=5643 RepID=A0A060SFB2_PYCCI|nr:hypothetical protein BN946_scf185007.g257 [Trametes cinnabarina]